MRTAVRMLQNHPQFLGVPVVAIPENAPGNAGPHLADHLVSYRGVTTMAEYNKAGTHFGVPATDRVDQTLFMVKLLAGGAICYSENAMTCAAFFFFSAERALRPRPNSYPGQSLDALKDKFEQQLLSWERLVKEDPSDPFASVKFKYTAKHSCGASPAAVVDDSPLLFSRLTSRLAGNDDLAVCGVMFDWALKFERSDKPSYVQFRKEFILPRIPGIGQR